MKYKKIEKKYIEDIKSEVTIYEHVKTGAKICTIENDDKNKVFSIAFRTPPINNGGLTHILEHSVLCGSKNFPVKDPFVELIKSSLNTFLNAFTFPDKTMYPCASQNDKDFKNLMHVYMDAVFYPNIYAHEEIFMQEGWHYHIENEQDPITYNGVVYNEMKGAFSNPQDVLYRTIFHSLYPDTPYGLEAGGNPKYIPDLNYEEFLNFHQQFYHPTNSYIFLYGDCDMDERLEWLDEAYLSSFDKNEFDTTIPFQKPFTSPVSETEYYPLSKEESLENKSFLSYNVALPSTLDTKKMIATSILVDALLNNPGAPLKQVLIDASLGADVSASFDDGLLQPMLAILVVNSDISKEEQFISLVDKTLKDLLVSGLDHDMLLSLINYEEFKTREGQFGYMPKGLEIQITCLASWLYDDKLPFQKLENLKYYAELKEDLKNGYFENILEELILNNPHKTYVKLVPSYTIGEEREKELTKRLADYKATLSKEEITALIEKNKALKVYQSTPSTEEEIATLPKLTIKDLNPLPEKYHCEKIEGEYPVLYSDYFTNGISYARYMFDISSLSFEELKYVALMANLFCQMPTKNKTFQEINQIVKNLTGGMQMRVISFYNASKEAKLMLEIKFSCLLDNLSKVSDLVYELLSETDFFNEKRLSERLNEVKSDNEMSISGKGHIVSMMRSAANFDEVIAAGEVCTGIAYLDFISDLVNNYNQKKKEIANHIHSLSTKLFAKSNFTLAYTGSKEDFNSGKKVFDKFYNSLSDKAEYQKGTFVPSDKNEGFKTQFDVNFVARTGKYQGPYCGSFAVLQNAISLDYLWMQVRVHGGAYGCMLNINEDGVIGFASYRDPELSRTNKVYEDVVNYIQQFNPSEEELLKYKIGAIGNLDPVLHPSFKAEKAQMELLKGYTYEQKTKYRKQTIETSKEDITALVTQFGEVLAQNHLCVIGNASEIEQNKQLFTDIRNLTQ